LELEFNLYHVYSCVNSRGNAGTVICATRVTKSVKSSPIRKNKTLQQKTNPRIIEMQRNLITVSAISLIAFPLPPKKILKDPHKT